VSTASFVIRDVRIFDGVDVIEQGSVSVRDGRIESVRPYSGFEDPTSDTAAYDYVIDGAHGTLLPGLIDSHAHPAGDALRQALLFGVTLEMDMFTVPERLGDQRETAARRDDVADIRSASTGATVLGGQPSMLIGLSFREQFPVVTGPHDAAQFVRDRIAEGADFIKFLIDDGAALGTSMPTLDEQTARIVVDEAHEHGLLAVAHATSAACTLTAIRAGADGLVHAYMNEPPSDDVVEIIRNSGVFVVPTLVTMGSLAGDLTGQAIADDNRVSRWLAPEWRQNLCACWQLSSPSSLANAKRVTAALHNAGVPLLAGTDAADVGVYGTAHGASLHQELAELVDCGLTAREALTAATAEAARVWRLPDRGRIAPGYQADMVLCQGDPTSRISASLSIRDVWRRGSRLDRVASSQSSAGVR
jgi:imidazolonepropionase-like amidohydrolase